jgi:hypothetical protein
VKLAADAAAFGFLCSDARLAYGFMFLLLFLEQLLLQLFLFSKVPDGP